MNNDVTKKMVEEGSKSVFQLAVSVFKQAGKFALDEIKIRKATEQYAESYVRRYGNVKVLGMSKPVSLNDLYTEVYITNPQYRTKEAVIDDLESNFRKSKGDFFSQQNRLSGLALANKEAKLNVLGSPGSGKTTFLRKIGLESLVHYNIAPLEKYEHECIPILIELKRFKSEEINLVSLLQKEFEIAGFPESLTFLKRCLKDGKLLILLDGLDEVPESKLTNILEHIKDFTDTYHKNRFITSCRIAYYKNYLTGFTDVEITNFNHDQITQFARNWFSSENDLNVNTAELFLQLLFEENNQATLELASTPLLLTFLCMTFDETQRFPVNRASLYKQALHILMQRWAAEKRIHNEDIYQNLNIEIETEMLADIAAYYFQKETIFFRGEDLKRRLQEFISQRITPENLNSTKVLEAIEVQQGILVERSFNIYSFSHLTVQEYLTAHYFNTPIRIHTLTEKYLFSKNWREVFLLLTGAGDPNDVLLLILKKLKSFSQENEIIRTTSKWVGSQIKRKLPEQAASYRIFLASLFLRFKRYDKNYLQSVERIESSANELIERVFPAFSDFFVSSVKNHINPRQAAYLLQEVNKWLIKPKDLECTISRIKSITPERPLSTMLHGSRQKYRRKILDEFYMALEIPNELCNLRKDKYKPLLKYMEGFSLLLDCASESSLTKKQTLNDIYDSIFSNKP